MLLRFFDLLGLCSTIIAGLALFMVVRSDSHRNAKVIAHAGGRLIIIDSSDGSLKYTSYAPWPVEPSPEWINQVESSPGHLNVISPVSSTIRSDWGLPGLEVRHGVVQLAIDITGQPHVGLRNSLDSWIGLNPPATSPPINETCVTLHYALVICLFGLLEATWLFTLISPRYRRIRTQRRDRRLQSHS